MAGKSAILAVKIIGDASNAIGSMGKAGLAVAGLGTAAVAAGALVGKALYDIGAAATDMDNTIRIGTGATGEALEGMQDTARDIARQVPNSLGEVGTAVADLNTNMGLTGPVLDTVARQVLEAGRMLGEDLDIKNAASTLNGFNVTAEETPDALDDIFRVSQATGTSMNDLTGQLSTQSGVLSELGLGLGDSAALIGGLSKAGIDSNAVLKGMGRSMTKLAKDGEPTADTFNRVMGELQGFIDTGDTAAAMDLATDLFGTRAAPQFIAALESGVLNMEDLMGATGATQDTILGLADETRTAGQQWDILKNNAMLALEPIGTVIFGAVGDALGALAEWIGTIDFTPIQEFADQIGPALGELGGQLGELLLPVLERIGPALTGMLEGGMPLTGMLDQMWPAVESIGQAFMDAMPVILEFGESLLPLIGGAIEAIIPLLMDIAETAIPAVMGIIEDVLPIVQNILETVVPAVIGAVEELVPKILEIVDPVMEIVSTLLDYLAPAVEFILPIVVGIFDALVTQISGAIDIIVAVLETVSNLLKGDWSAAWESIKGVVDGAITMVEGMIDQGMAIISGITGQTIDDIKRTFRDGWARIVDTVKTKAGDLIGEVKALPGKIKSGLGNMANLLRSAGRDLIQGMISGVTNRITTLLTRVRDIPRRIKSALGNLGTLLRSAGRDLIRGMINGIGSMGTALKNKAGDLAGGAVNAIKKRLGIASPSKVLTTIGLQTGEGFVRGVDRMRRDADRAMSGLVTVPDAPQLPVPDLGARGTRRGGDTYLTINLSGVVGDRHAVRRTIEEAMGEAARRAGRAGLGSRLVVA